MVAAAHATPAEDTGGCDISLIQVDGIEVHGEAVAWISALHVVEVCCLHKLVTTPGIGQHTQRPKCDCRDRSEMYLFSADRRCQRMPKRNWHLPVLQSFWVSFVFQSVSGLPY